MKRFELINFLIKKNNYKTYLEIGVETGYNFKNVICEIKDGVDPFIKNEYEFLDKNREFPVNYKITSDEFFRKKAPELQYKYDLIFIDGLHISEQVDKDINNSLKYLNENGIIVLHDCNPLTIEHQAVPRTSLTWNGDVWKSIVKKRMRDPELIIFVVDTDTGLGIITKNKDFKMFQKPMKKKDITNLDWDFLEKNRKESLNLISPSDFLINYIKNDL